MTQNPPDRGPALLEMQRADEETGQFWESAIANYAAIRTSGDIVAATNQLLHANDDQIETLSEGPLRERARVAQAVYDEYIEDHQNRFRHLTAAELGRG